MFWWIFQNLIIAGALAAIVQLVSRAGRLGPVGRHALWVVVLVKLLTPPLVVWPWPVSADLPLANIVLQNRTPEPVTVAPGFSPLVPASGVGPATASATMPLSAAAESPAPVLTAVVVQTASPLLTAIAGGGWIPIALTIWLIGAVVFASIQALRIVRLLGIVRRSTPAGQALTTQVEVLARQMRMRPVDVRIVSDLGSPAIWCLHRPVLLWPRELAADAHLLRLRGLIVHELAHVKRGDHLVGWLELIAGCVWWWNPVFWFVRAQLRENAELACDAWVIQTIPDGRRAYAEALLGVCAGSPAAAVAMPVVGVTTGSRRFLERRLSMIMKGRVPLRLSWFTVVCLAILASAALPAWEQRGTSTTAGRPAGAIEVRPEVDGVRSRPVEVRPEGPGLAQVRPADGRRAPAGALLPPEAQQLVDRFAEQQEAARREADQKIARQRQDLRRELQSLQDGFSRSGRLDEALAVRNRIRQLDGGAVTETSAVPLASRTNQRGDFNASPLPRSADVDRRGVTATGTAPRSDPGNLVDYRGRIGQSFTFRVTGSASGMVWGSDLYTDDSTLSAAVVHAGLLRPGQRGIVRVTILPARSSYAGSIRNGIESSDYGEWQGSYDVELVSADAEAPVEMRPEPARAPLAARGLGSFRDRVGETMTMPVIGSTDGTIWGSGVYTDDSPLAVAAVHAGAVEAGQFGFVRVTILPGFDEYIGTSRNRVSSQYYKEWGGSYRVERAPQPWPTDLGVITLPRDASANGFTRSLRGQHGLSFSVEVVGASGSVWGTDVYTDDSSIAAAAVHAGVLRRGERGLVTVTILPGRDRYEGSDRRGISSSDYGGFGGSFRVSK